MCADFPEWTQCSYQYVNRGKEVKLSCIVTIEPSFHFDLSTALRTGAYFADTMPRVSEQTVPLSMELI